MNAKQQQAIEQHGRQLLAIFPHAAEQDPVKLCKKLRRLEAIGQRIALRLCNGPEYGESELEDAKESLRNRVNDLLFGVYGADVPVVLNMDPRGYALKIDDEWMRKWNKKLTQDWGGYGIIAPEIK